MAGRRVGRPRRSGGVSHNITIRVTDAERSTWVAAAGDMPLSEWIRQILNKESGCREPQ